jgi:hypothetical protein
MIRSIPLTIACAVLVGLPLAASAQPPPARAPELDPASRAALARLPFDTALVGSVHLAALRRLPLGRRLLAALERDRDFQQLLAELRQKVGFDHQRDLERVWVAMPPAAFDGSGQIAFVARLSIDQERMRSWLRRKGGRGFAERRLGHAVYYLVDGAAWAFLDRDHLLVARVDYVDDVLRAASGRRHSAAANRALLTAAAAAGGDAHAWLAVLLPEATRTELRRDPLTAALADVRWISGEIALGDVTRWRARLKTSRRESARALLDMMKQMIEAAAGSREVAALRLSDPIRATRVAAEGEIVLLEGSLARAAADAVVEALRP